MADKKRFEIETAFVFEEGLDLSSEAFRLYVTLAGFLRAKQKDSPSLEEIAGILGVSSRSVSRAMSELRERGLVEVERPGLGQPNRYRLAVDGEESSEPQSGDGGG